MITVMTDLMSYSLLHHLSYLKIFLSADGLSVRGSVWFGEISGCALGVSWSQFVPGIKPEGSRQNNDSLAARAATNTQFPLGFGRPDSFSAPIGEPNSVPLLL